MSDLLSSVEVTIDTSAVGPYLQERTTAIRVALAEKMTAVSTMLQSKIVGDKLSGQLLNRRSGKLSDSVRVEAVVATETEIDGGVTAGGGPVNYAAALEDGAKAHVIMPKNAKALAFMIDGKQIFAMRVNHPGNRAYSYMKGTLTENADTIRGEFQDAASEAAQS